MTDLKVCCDSRPYDKVSLLTDKMTKARQQFAAKNCKIVSITGDTHLKRTLEMCEELWVESYLEEAKPDKCQRYTKCFTENDETIYRICTRPHSR